MQNQDVDPSRHCSLEGNYLNFSCFCKKENHLPVSICLCRSVLNPIKVFEETLPWSLGYFLFGQLSKNLESNYKSKSQIDQDISKQGNIVVNLEQLKD